MDLFSAGTWGFPRGRSVQGTGANLLWKKLAKIGRGNTSRRWSFCSPQFLNTDQVSPLLSSFGGHSAVRFERSRFVGAESRRGSESEGSIEIVGSRWRIEITNRAVESRYGESKLNRGRYSGRDVEVEVQWLSRCRSQGVEVEVSKSNWRREICIEKSRSKILSRDKEDRRSRRGFSI